jgi:hypothetical protein
LQGAEVSNTVSILYLSRVTLSRTFLWRDIYNPGSPKLPLRTMITASQAVAVLLIALLLVSGIGLSDADGDGLGNHKEWFGPTGWLTADTDDDGLSDGEERELGSDPTAGDTSGDRIADGIAAEYELDPSERYPSTLVSALVMAHQRYPGSAERLVNAVYHSGPTPGELTAFEKRQLRLWMDAPSDYQDAIISKRYFHKDDWDKDGGAQTLPNGSVGPDINPFTPDDRDGDGILRWYYNADAQVYDPKTDECEGFDPGEDTVGEFGGCEGDGGLAELGASPNRFDLFVEIDYMTADNHSNRPRAETVRRIERTLDKQGITAHIVVDERLPHRTVTDNRTDAPAFHHEHLSTVRRGVFVHGLFVHDAVVVIDGIEHTADGYGNRSVAGRGFFMAGWKSEQELSATMFVETLVEWQVYATLHEIGHVGGLEHTADPNSIMGEPTANQTLEFSEQERERLVATFGERPYYDSIVEE